MTYWLVNQVSLFSLILLSLLTIRVLSWAVGNLFINTFHICSCMMVR